MFLYHLTLQASTTITKCTTGYFTSPSSQPRSSTSVLVQKDTLLTASNREHQHHSQASDAEDAILANQTAQSPEEERLQELVILKGTSILEVYATDRVTGKLKLLSHVETFSVIRGMVPFRPVGFDKDLLAVTSDSGKLTMLDFDGHKWTRVLGETIGRSGCRRTIAGHYLAADPVGRIIMVAAIDRQKFFYSVNKRDRNTDDTGISTTMLFKGRFVEEEGLEDEDATSLLSISTPIEAHTPDTITFDLVSLDCGYENPRFATLEVEYAGIDEIGQTGAEQSKQLVIYEVELAIHHATRRAEYVVPRGAYKLIPIPGGDVLVLVDEEGKESPILGQVWGVEHGLIVSIPLPSFFLFVTSFCWVQTVGETKPRQVFLATEQGLILMLKLVKGEDASYEFKLTVLDKVEQSAPPSMAFLSNGLLMITSMNGPAHCLYQIIGLEDKKLVDYHENSNCPLTNLLPIDDSLFNDAPCTDALVMNLGQHQESTAQVYTCQADKYVNILRPGLPVSEVASTDLPEEATGVWVIQDRTKVEEVTSTPSSSWIVLSFVNSTKVLSVGLDGIDELEGAGGLLLDRSTVGAFELDDGSIVQVHSKGLRHINYRPGTRSSSVTIDLKVSGGGSQPSNAKIELATCNGRQLVLAMDTRQLVLFELQDRALRETQKSPVLPEGIVSMHIAPLPPGRQRAKFMVVGCTDEAVRVLTLYPEERCFEPTAIQALTARPGSVILATDLGSTALCLCVGLDSGIYLTLACDIQTGALSDPRSRQLQPKSSDRLTPVHLAIISPDTESTGVLVCCPTINLTWLHFARQGHSRQNRVFYGDALSKAAPITIDLYPGAIVTLAQQGQSLRILCFDTLDATFARHRVTLDVPVSRHLSWVPEIQRFMLTHPCRPPVTFDPFDGSVEWPLGQELPVDCALTAACFCSFWSKPGECFLVLCLKQQQSDSKANSKFWIALYHVHREATAYALVYNTEIEEEATVAYAFDGRLLVSIGSTLRLYDLGMKRLLRKCEARLTSPCIRILHQGRRLFCATLDDSVHGLLYMNDHNRFFLYIDDTIPRPLSTGSAMCLLDQDTVVVGDRYGGIAVLRISTIVSERVTNQPSGMSEREVLHGAPNKFERVAEFRVSPGDPIIALYRIDSNVGTHSNSTPTSFGNSTPFVFYMTMTGVIGALLPLPNQSTTLLLQNLELALRNPTNPITSIPPSSISKPINNFEYFLPGSTRRMNRVSTTALDLATERSKALFPTGRDHLRYRGHHIPVKSVIDGDLCELYAEAPRFESNSPTFSSLRVDDQWRKDIAEGLERDQAEIIRKVIDQRASIGF